MEQAKLTIHSIVYREKDSPPAAYTLSDTTVLPKHHGQLLETLFRAILGDPHAVNRLKKQEVCLEEALVSCGTKQYRVVIRDGIVRAYTGSIDRTEEYLQLFRHTKEEMNLIRFKPANAYPTRMSAYKLGRIHRLQYTRPVGYSATFQFHMRRFIKAFQPERLVPGKNFFLHLRQDGLFSIRCGDQEMPPLSETEHILYHYLCFLHLQQFWAQILQLHSLDGPILPVIVPDVLSRLDESIHRESVIARGSQLNRQVIFLE